MTAILETKAAKIIFALGAAGITLFALQYDRDVNITLGETAQAYEGTKIPAPIFTQNDKKEGLQVAVFAAGCFWSIEEIFQKLEGVDSAESGYSGGLKSTATYKQVSAGETKHAESVKVVYDPTKISYAQLLHVFFAVTHDPTQVDRQGPDIGAEYRSSVFSGNDAERKIVQSYIQQLDKTKAWDKPIATKIEDFSFFKAEDYHQDFVRKNPDNGYVRMWDMPKVKKLKIMFPHLLKK